MKLLTGVFLTDILPNNSSSESEEYFERYFWLNLCLQASIYEGFAVRLSEFGEHFILNFCDNGVGGHRDVGRSGCVH